jgi:hypothetical protein
MATKKRPASGGFGTHRVNLTTTRAELSTVRDALASQANVLESRLANGLVDAHDRPVIIAAIRTLRNLVLDTLIEE